MFLTLLRIVNFVRTNWTAACKNPSNSSICKGGEPYEKELPRSLLIHFSTQHQPHCHCMRWSEIFFKFSFQPITVRERALCLQHTQSILPTPLHCARCSTGHRGGGWGKGLEGRNLHTETMGWWRKILQALLISTSITTHRYWCCYSCHTGAVVFQEIDVLIDNAPNFWNRGAIIRIPALLKSYWISKFV